MAFYEAKKYSIHAEQDCINKCRNKNILKYCTLVLIKFGTNQQIRSCQPCQMCSHIIRKYGVRKIEIVTKLNL